VEENLAAARLLRLPPAPPVPPRSPGRRRASRPGPAVLRAQQRILALLDPGHHADDASRTFTDLWVVSALLCMSWPLGRDLVDPVPAAAVDEHVTFRISGVRPKALDKQPAGVPAAAGLLTAAVTILDTPRPGRHRRRHVEARKPSRPSKSAWSALIERHYSACSPAMRDAADPTTRAYRRTSGPHSPKAPFRAGAYCPEHIPALLEQQWYDEHLAGLGYPGTTTMRRAESVLLVQWAHGRSLGEAARYLGIQTGRSQHSFGPDLARWLRDHGSKDFTAALHRIAIHRDGTAYLINYRHRRQVMQAWCLDPETWQEVTSACRPSRDLSSPSSVTASGKKASAFTWALVTQGEPRFAPRPIEASQPEQVRKDWNGRKPTSGTSSRAPAGSSTTPNSASSSSSTATAWQKTSTTAPRLSFGELSGDRLPARCPTASWRVTSLRSHVGYNALTPIEPSALGPLRASPQLPHLRRMPALAGCFACAYPPLALHERNRSALICPHRCSRSRQDSDLAPAGSQRLPGRRGGRDRRHRPRPRPRERRAVA
jgi:hypothetical protein